MSGTLIAALPWTDKKGRVHTLRSVVFVLILVPGLVLAVRWGVWGLGTRPLKVAIHSTGYWAVWLLLASLLISPLKALTGNTQLTVVRRMVGLASLVYALVHVTLYVIDEGGGVLHLLTEIVSRFYLTIGALAAAGLIVLGVTSTDGIMRRMGTQWKQLHRLAYLIATLTAVHYVLQSKADVSQALVAIGVFVWLMLWRTLPAGRDRTPVPVLGLAVAAALTTVLSEYVWYRFGTRIDPVKAVRLEADLRYGLHPAALVLALGLLAAGAVAVRRAGQGAWGQRMWFTIVLYASGALAGPLGAFLFGLPGDDETGRSMLLSLMAVPVFALMGWARFTVRDAGPRRLLDAVWAAAAIYPAVLMLDLDDRRILMAGGAIVVAATLLTSTRVWRISRLAAVLLLPLSGWVAYEATAALA